MKFIPIEDGSWINVDRVEQIRIEQGEDHWHIMLICRVEDYIWESFSEEEHAIEWLECKMKLFL